MSILKNTAEAILKHLPPLNIALRSRKIYNDNKTYPRAFKVNNEEDNPLLDKLSKHGYAVLPDYFDADFCAACVKSINNTVENHPEFVRKREDERLFGSQNICAELKAFHDDPRFSNLANSYYGAPSGVGVSMANRLGFVEGQSLGSGGDWHRDRMLRQFKTLVYLEDVTEKDGPFQFIDGSHTYHENRFREDSKITGLPNPITRLTDKDVQPLIKQRPERLITFTAKKGTVILVDTSGIHRGSPLNGGKRYAVFNYYYPETRMNRAALNEKFAPLVPDDFSQ